MCNFVHVRMHNDSAEQLLKIVIKEMRKCAAEFCNNFSNLCKGIRDEKLTESRNKRRVLQAKNDCRN